MRATISLYELDGFNDLCNLNRLRNVMAILRRVTFVQMMNSPTIRIRNVKSRTAVHKYVRAINFYLVI